MSSRSTLRIILTAMFAALICVATMFTRIPTPGTGGYANAGDGLMLTAAFLLPPGCAAIAAGVGSMLSDLLAGYMSYVPGTLVIKGVMALVAALMYEKMGRTSGSRMPVKPTTQISQIGGKISCRRRAISCS